MGLLTTEDLRPIPCKYHTAYELSFGRKTWKSLFFLILILIFISVGLPSQVVLHQGTMRSKELTIIQTSDSMTSAYLGAFAEFNEAAIDVFAIVWAVGLLDPISIRSDELQDLEET
jgi:hypothetical protein